MKTSPSKPIWKVCWLTFIPRKGIPLQTFISQFGEGDFEDRLPCRCWGRLECLELVKDLNSVFDYVAGMFSPQIIEAIRNYKVQHFKEEGIKFARWVSPSWDKVNGGREICRWFVIG